MDNKTAIFFVSNKKCEEMKNDRIGLSKEPGEKKHSPKTIFISGEQQLSEKEYEEYYNRIRQLSRGL